MGVFLFKFGHGFGLQKPLNYKTIVRQSIGNATETVVITVHGDGLTGKAFPLARDSLGFKIVFQFEITIGKEGMFSGKTKPGSGL